jgi:PIN domain nuclease of toxin-antitoxin system
MKIVLDTHVFTWVLANSPRLSSVAREVIAQSEDALVSTVSLFEIAQKVRIGKWADMEPVIGRLTDELAKQGTRSVPPSAEICILAGQMPWSHRDPFDRIIAATALVLDLVLVSADTAFDSLPGLRRVW